ncbi:MAG TPA: hypothetical protein VMT28_10560 [Terriglobales bacterium]|jgi:hypothetical protein|nr:hypothetical protein [Terriglobales bacterium]
MVLSLGSISAGCICLACWALSGAPLQAYLLFLLEFDDKRSNAYNILWVLVFGFATLNILSLVTRRFEPSRKTFNFGEMLAILVVVVSFILLGWELLYVFNILPIKLEPR